MNMPFFSFICMSRVDLLFYSDTEVAESDREIPTTG